jgi:hypothetical protein
MPFWDIVVHFSDLARKPASPGLLTEKRTNESGNICGSIIPSWDFPFGLLSTTS